MTQNLAHWNRFGNVGDVTAGTLFNCRFGRLCHVSLRRLAGFAGLGRLGGRFLLGNGGRHFSFPLACFYGSDFRGLTPY